MKQYLFGGPHDGKVINTNRPAEPVLALGSYTQTGKWLGLERYELRPLNRLDRRFWVQPVDATVTKATYR